MIVPPTGFSVFRKRNRLNFRAPRKRPGATAMEYAFALSSLLVLGIGIIETTSDDVDGIFRQLEVELQASDDDQSSEGSDNDRRRRRR